VVVGVGDEITGVQETPRSVSRAMMEKSAHDLTGQVCLCMGFPQCLFYSALQGVLPFKILTIRALPSIYRGEYSSQKTNLAMIFNLQQELLWEVNGEALNYFKEPIQSRFNFMNG
jgi:hypothetical protein